MSADISIKCGLHLRVSAPAPKMAPVSFSGNGKKITSMIFFNSDFLAFVANKIDADFIQKYYRSIFSIICCNFWPGRLPHRHCHTTPHCHCCVADSDLVTSAFPTFSRPPSSLLLLCGWLRSCRLGLSDVLKAAVVWPTQISSPQPFWRSQGHRPHCHCCLANSDLVASAFLTFSRPPSSLPLLFGRLRSRRLSLSDILKATVLIASVVCLADSDLVASAFLTFSRPPSSLPLLFVWPTQILSPQPFWRSQGHRPHCHCCLADSDLVASAFLTFSSHRPHCHCCLADSDLVASAFPTFSRPPSSLLLLCGWLRSRRLGLSDILKATVVWLTQISSPRPFRRSQGHHPHFPSPNTSPLCFADLCWTLLTQGHLPQVHVTFRHPIPRLFALLTFAELCWPKATFLKFTSLSVT